MNNSKLNIDGMTCGHCVAQVSAAIKSVAGAEVIEIRVGSAEFRFDPAKASARDVAAAVSAIGYPATVDPSQPPVSSSERTACGCGCGPK
jgi:copper chaperone